MFKSLVKAMKKTHKEVLRKYEEGDSFDVPDGRYIAKITKFTDKLGKNTGTPMLVVQRTIVEGPCKGKMVFQNMFPGHPNMGHRFLFWVESLGYERPEPEDLPELLDTIVEDEGLHEEIEVSKNSDGFLDVESRRVLEDYTPEEDEDSEEEDDESEEDDQEEDESDDESEEDESEDDDDQEDEDSEEEDDESEEDESDDSETKDNLIALAYSHHDDLELDDEWSLEEIKEQLSDKVFIEDQLDDEEKDLLTNNDLAHTIQAKSKPKGKTKSKKKSKTAAKGKKSTKKASKKSATKNKKSTKSKKASKKATKKRKK